MVILSHLIPSVPENQSTGRTTATTPNSPAPEYEAYPIECALRFPLNFPCRILSLVEGAHPETCTYAPEKSIEESEINDCSERIMILQPSRPIFSFGNGSGF